MKKSAIVLAVALFTALGAAAQQQRLSEFQDLMSTQETLYHNLMRSGRHSEAVAPLTTLVHVLDTTTIHRVTPIPAAALKAQKALYLYDLACCHARTGKKKLALRALGQAVENGYSDYRNMLNDNDLLSVRATTDYQSLLAQVAARRPLEVLRRSAPYGPDTVALTGDAPLFVYQPRESMNLRNVRQYFKLDSVAGHGDELSQIINLLHFAHDNIRHDGSNRAFAEMDAIDLYNYVKATGKGVNCRQLAISLCEMYLAMGFPARYVTCMPADPNDFECHVINTVWSSQLDKWLYIDPTMDAWVTDEHGTMLSIDEVRSRLIDDRPLVLCETANWNHETPQTKENYLDDYMSKNLYYFVCKKVSRFNPESIYRDGDPADDVMLLPVGYASEIFKCDATTSPQVFWARP
jgi:hypothetical protein